MKKFNKATLSLDKQPNKKIKEALINRVLDLEPLGVLNLNRLKTSKSFQSSTDEIGPTDPGSIIEFGLSGPAIPNRSYLILPTISMAYNLLKLEIFKEAFCYHDPHTSWMLRLVNTENKYPKFHFRQTLKMFDGRETAEVIFICRSAESVRAVQKWLQLALDGLTLQDAVDEALACTSDIIEKKLFEEDLDIKEFFDEYAPLMIGSYESNTQKTIVNKKQKKGKKND